ncbi:hypothetical protein ACLOJK_009888 [Asimina triloba]
MTGLFEIDSGGRTKGGIEAFVEREKKRQGRAYVLPRLSSIARESDEAVEANEDADDGACGGEHLWRICRVEAKAETTCGGDNGRKIEGFSRSSEVDEAADYGAETICRGVVDICGGCVK